jgi:hypothetical protein
MNDFLDAHSHTKGPKPKLTRSRSSIPAVKPRAAAVPSKSPKSSSPEWLSDFGPSATPAAPASPASPVKPSAPAASAAPARREPAAAEPAPKKKPDWMSDFE